MIIVGLVYLNNSDTRHWEFGSIGSCNHFIAKRSVGHITRVYVKQLRNKHHGL